LHGNREIPTIDIGYYGNMANTRLVDCCLGDMFENSMRDKTIRGGI
jgi:hypothetical protein